ncbi:hypothetical protein D1872_255270 [compost metagenome]
MNNAVQVHASLGVHGNHMSACFGERRNILLGLLDHQVHVQRQIGQRRNRPHDEGPERQIRHKMAVHDVHMEPIRSRALHVGYFFAELGKIRR